MTNQQQHALGRIAAALEIEPTSRPPIEAALARIAAKIADEKAAAQGSSVPSALEPIEAAVAAEQAALAAGPVAMERIASALERIAEAIEDTARVWASKPQA